MCTGKFVALVMLSVIRQNAVVPSDVILIVIVLNVVMLIVCFAKCRCAKCHCAECRGAVTTTHIKKINFKLVSKMFFKLY
jgi:hypothetical protein